MNYKECVKNVIYRKQTDFIPYSFDLTSVMKDKIASYYGMTSENVHNFIGDSLYYVWRGNSIGFIPKEINENEIQDEFGVIWDTSSKLQNIGDWGGIVSSPLKEVSFQEYRFPDTSKLRWFDNLNEEELKASDRYLIIGMDGIFDIAWHIRGFENLLLDFMDEEHFVNELLDKALEYNLGVIEQVPSYFNGIRFGEDWGQQKGLIMGASLWRKYLKPRLRIMYEAARKRGFNVFIHTCGDIFEIFPDIIEIGVDVVNPIQPEVMDVSLIKRNYGKDLVLYGGMGCQSTLPYGNTQEVINEAKSKLRVLGDSGGYIFGPAGAIPTDVKIENVIALIEFLRNGCA